MIDKRDRPNLKQAKYFQDLADKEAAKGAWARPHVVASYTEQAERARNPPAVVWEIIAEELWGLSFAYEKGVRVNTDSVSFKSEAEMDRFIKEAGIMGWGVRFVTPETMS